MRGPKPKIVIAAGDKFGRWTVLEEPYSNGQLCAARCRCECGTVREVLCRELRSGGSKSCGCLRASATGKRNTTHGDAPRGHVSRLLKAWGAMRRRCYSPSCAQYGDYGGRGIQVCEAWRNDYVAFRDWALSSGYTDKSSLDRINNDGDYAPENCRWTSMTVQNRNRRFNRMLTIFGETKCMSEWGEDQRCNVIAATFRSRIGDGWEPEEALTKRARKGHRL